MKEKTLTNLKSGDIVWFQYINLGTNGKIQDRISPVQLKVLKIANDSIYLNFSNIFKPWRIPDCYNINATVYATNKKNLYKYGAMYHISFSKEQSIKQFNESIDFCKEECRAIFEKIEKDYNRLYL